MQIFYFKCNTYINIYINLKTAYTKPMMCFAVFTVREISALVLWDKTLHFGTWVPAFQRQATRMLKTNLACFSKTLLMVY
jgi:hypothetical protein